MAQFTENPILTHRFTRALDWASQIHRNQIRKDGTPYVGHLLQVSGLVLEAGGTEDQAIAALLHDAVEDCGIDQCEIQCRFGPVVRQLVRALTMDPPGASLESRTLAYCQNIQANPDAILVSAADKLHNLRGYARKAAAFTPQAVYLYNQVWPIYKTFLGEGHPFCREIAALVTGGQIFAPETPPPTLAHRAPADYGYEGEG